MSLHSVLTSSASNLGESMPYKNTIIHDRIYILLEIVKFPREKPDGLNEVLPTALGIGQLCIELTESAPGFDIEKLGCVLAG